MSGRQDGSFGFVVAETDVRLTLVIHMHIWLEVDEAKERPLRFRLQGAWLPRSASLDLNMLAD